MNINEENIQKKEFHVVFKGYKPEEVDKFLDVLAVEFNKLQKANRELQETLDRVKYEEGKESVEMKKVIQEALVSAHKVAEDIKQKAKKEAEDIARIEIVKEEESYKTLMDEKGQLEEDIAKLGKKYEDFKVKISEMVDDLKNLASKTGEEKILSTSEIDKQGLDINKIMTDEGAKEEKEEDDSSEKEPEAEEDIEYNNQEEQIEIEKPEEEDIDKDKENQEFVHSDEEEEDDEYKPKRVKKKMDIANPDIINDFFKTDED